MQVGFSQQAKAARACAQSCNLPPFKARFHAGEVLCQAFCAIGRLADGSLEVAKLPCGARARGFRLRVITQSRPRPRSRRRASTQPLAGSKQTRLGAPSWQGRGPLGSQELWLSGKLLLKTKSTLNRENPEVPAPCWTMGREQAAPEQAAPEQLGRPVAGGGGCAVRDDAGRPPPSPPEASWADPGWLGPGLRPRVGARRKLELAEPAPGGLW
jgi:hypothetical protein